MNAIPLPRLLAFHQSLLALAVFLAAHQTPGSEFGRVLPHGVLPAVAVVNAAVWLLVTRRRVPGNVFGPLQRASLWLWIPAAYFFAVSIVDVFRDQLAPGAWLLGLTTYALTLWTATHVFGAARDARFAFSTLTVCGLAVCAEGAILLLTRGDPRGLLAHGPFWSGWGGVNAPAILGFALMDSNALASFLIVAASFSLGLWATAQTPRARALAVTSFCIFTICVFLTGSRGGAPFFVVLLLAWAAGRGKMGRTAAAVGAAALFGAILVALARTAGGILRGDANLKNRFHMARASLHVLREHPILGGGPDAFAREWKQYSHAFGYGTVVTQPDGLLWSLLAEGGLLMAAMAAILVIGLTAEIRRVLRQTGRSAPRELLLSLSLGLAAALGHDTLETTFRTPVMTLFLCLLVGLTLGTSARQTRTVEYVGKNDA